MEEVEPVVGESVELLNMAGGSERMRQLPRDVRVH